MQFPLHLKRLKGFIYYNDGWPHFQWDASRLMPLLAEVRHQQGRLMGMMAALGFDLQNLAHLEALSYEVIKSSEIEGEVLKRAQVRSSVARKLGLDIAGTEDVNRYVDGVVDMMMDATVGHNHDLTAERLFDWHAALFPTGRSGMHKIVVGDWRLSLIHI